MFVLTVCLTFEPGARDALLPLLLENARHAVASEPGCLQFDVCQHPDQPDVVFLYEVFESRAAHAAHRLTPHYRAFASAAEGRIRTKTGQDYRRLD